MSRQKEYLQLACDALAKHLPDNTGFILLTFPLGPDGILTYASNANREDCVALMKEWLIRAGHEEDWMKHLD